MTGVTYVCHTGHLGPAARDVAAATGLDTGERPLYSLGNPGPPKRCWMKTKLFLPFALAISIFAICGPALAHHGGAQYGDSAIELKQATVTKFLWSNPHSLLDFDVKDDKGNTVHWVGETGAPSSISLIGWYKTCVQPGDVITVYIYPAKSGNPVGRLNRIVLADGTEYHDTQLGAAGGKGRYNPEAGDKPGADSSDKAPKQ